MPAPGKGKTNVDEAVTSMCSTITSLMYDANQRWEADWDGLGKKLFYDTLEKQGDGQGLQPVSRVYRIFDDHGPLKRLLPPMATAVMGDTMIIGWRGSVRGCPHPWPARPPPP